MPVNPKQPFGKGIPDVAWVAGVRLNSKKVVTTKFHERLARSVLDIPPAAPPALIFTS